MAMILVVEDETFIRESAVWTVEDLGHEALTAHDVATARAHLSSDAPIDSLFVDIRLAALPLGGYEVADHAVNIRPGLPVLYTSGTTLTLAMTGRFVAGGRFLQKPYSSDQLEACIGAMLQ